MVVPDTFEYGNRPMTQIRVVIANMPEVLLQMVAQAIAEQPDMLLVGQARDNLEVLQAAQTDVDLIILGATQVTPCPGICSHLLSEFPQLKILLVAPGSDVGRAYWLGLRQRKVATTSMAILLHNIRQLHQFDVMD